MFPVLTSSNPLQLENFMKKIYTLATLFLFTTLAATAQIKGKLQDKTDDKPINAATVTLLKQADSIEVGKTISTSAGIFEFTGVAAGKYIVQVEALNYQQNIYLVTATDTGVVNIIMTLTRQGKDLGTVTVIARTPPVIQKGDTSQFSASQYKVNPDATTEDLIKKMPGITVAKDGTVTAQGEQVKKVTIDGKDFFGDDASAALKNLPSEVVDKIQVFDRLSDQAKLTGFDDGNSVKSINVVTKSGIKNGQFGRVYAGYGTNDRYSAGGNVSFFKGDKRLSLVGNFNNINQQNFASQDLLGVSSSSSARGGGGQGGFVRGGGGGDQFSVGQASGISKTNSFGVNFGNKYGPKLEVTGSYFYNNSTNTNSSLVNTETFGKNTKNILAAQTANSNTENTNHRINLRVEYKIDSNNSLFIIPNISFQKNNSNTSGTLKSYYGSSDSLNTSLSNINAAKNGYNIRNNILFRHSFAKKGRSISLGFNTAFIKNNGETYTDASYRFFNSGSITDSLQNQFADNISNGKTYGGTIAYTEPAGKKGQIQVDYNPSIQKNNADQQTFKNDGQKYSIFLPQLSNNFENTITTNNAGITYRYSQNKDALFSIGVSYQHSQLESDRILPTITSVNKSFTNVLPNLIWRKKISANSNIRIFYRSSVNFPSISQLQDVVNLSNPLRISTGNPDLKQSFTNFVAGRYSYTNSKTSKSFFANIFAQTASDYISSGIFVPQADSAIQQGIIVKKGSQLSKPVNLNGYSNIRTFLTYSMPLKFIKTTLNVNAGFGYSKLPGQVNNGLTNTDNFTYNGGVVLASNISEYVDFNISYAANFNDAKTTGANVSVNNYVNQTTGVQLNLLSKKGWFVQNDVSYQNYTGLSAGLNQSYTLWNAAIGKKFLANRAGELKISVFDLLKQNQSISRTVTGNYIEDAQTQVLQQYFMATFTYNLKNFGKAKKSFTNNRDEDRPMMRTPGGPAF